MLNVRDNVDLWDFTSHSERVKIRCGLCKDPMFVLVFGPLGVEYCIIVSLLVVLDFLWTTQFVFPNSKCKVLWDSMGMYCFWLLKNISTSLAWEFGLESYFKGFSNLWTKRVPCNGQRPPKPSRKHTTPPKKCCHKYNNFAFSFFYNVWKSHIGFFCLF